MRSLQSTIKRLQKAIAAAGVPCCIDVTQFWSQDEGRAINIYQVRAKMNGKWQTVSRAASPAETVKAMAALLDAARGAANGGAN